MTFNGWIQILIYCAIVIALVKPLGWYMTRVFSGERTFLSPVLRPIEALLCWLGGVDGKRGVLIVGGLTLFPALALGPIVKPSATTAGSLF